MDVLGFVLIILGAVALAEQLLNLFASLVLFTGLRDLDKVTVHYLIGRIGIALIAAGVVIRYVF
jgi:hypothetical protein